MKNISPILNIMIKATEKASKVLIRDFGELENLQVTRKGPKDFVTNSDKKVEKILIEELQKSRKADFNAKRTLIGPHKTDFLVNHSIKNIQAKNCSTGEQKSLLLSLFILSSLAISKKFGKPPIILLDEIVAHLDKENLSIFLDQLISINAQIFATGTDRKNLDNLPVDFSSYSLDWNNGKSKVFLS